MISLHRAALLATGLSFLAAAGAACASSSEDPPDTPPDSDGGAADRTAPDASADAPDATDADARAREVDACTSAGWCSIEVDPRLSFDDLWPLEGSAVAIASRSDRSSVLLYRESSWSVLYEVAFKLTSVWASSTDVWVAGDAGYVAHGRREGASFVWTERPLPVEAKVSTVWGTGDGEIYALADARVWRLSPGEDGGGDWKVDFGGVAPDPETTLSALVGTGKDDIWVTGYRGTYPNCSLIMHKTSGAWVSVVEGTPVFPPEPWLPPSCAPAGSAVAIDSILEKATATASGEIVVVVRAGPTLGSSFARVRHSPSSGIDVVTAPRTKEQTSLWGAGADDLYTTRFSVVERGRDIWTDGGTWQISTVAFEGIALVKPLHVVRGRRSDDIWLAGESYVFHKTSP